MKHSLYTLQNLLAQYEIGDTFKIKGQLNYWELYDENEGFYFVRNTISKQEILMRKP